MKKFVLLRLPVLLATTASAILSVVAIAAVPAWAHSELIESTPAAGEVLPKAPSRVELVFNEPVQDEGGTISVWIRDTTVSDDSTFSVNGTTASVQLRGGGASSQAGRYTVQYRLVSEDGHVISDSYAFEVRDGSSQASDDPTADTTPLSTDDSHEPEESSASVVWVLGAGAIGLALVAALIAVATRGRRGRSS